MERNNKGQFVKGGISDKPMLGKKHSVETKEKMRLARMKRKQKLGYLISLEAREKIRKAKTGKKRPPFSKEWIDKMKKARKGRKPNLGNHHSEETKKKFSEQRKGIKKSEEHKKKIGLANWRGGTYLEKQEKIASRKRPEICDICQRMGNICFDHDHKTGKFRGWICSNCNVALGMVDDNPQILIEMINYISNT